MSDSQSPKPRTRHDGWTGERRRTFLDALATAGNVRDACRAVGLSSTSAYRIRRLDRAFAADWDAALARSAKSLEAVAYARAVEGVEEPVYQGGQLVGTKLKTSDALLRLLLQGANPEKYGRTGGQPSVQLREELEARVGEIEAAAYRRAWDVFVAEYRYQLEPYLMRRYVARLLHRMNNRMCGNAYCRECHPERFDRDAWNWDYVTDPGEDHQTIDMGKFWSDYVSREYTDDQIKANASGGCFDEGPKDELLENARGYPKRDEKFYADCRRAEAMGLPKYAWQRAGWEDPRKQTAIPEPTRDAA